MKICKMAVVGLIGVLAWGTAIAETSTVATGSGKAIPSGSVEAGMAVKVGAMAFSIPDTWETLSGEEAEQAMSEIKQGQAQMQERYRQDTGMAHAVFNIQDFKAIRLSSHLGWCIVYETKMPVQDHYYKTIAKDAQAKFDWGLSQGLIERVLENGMVDISGSPAMKYIVTQKSGGRMTSMVHCSAKDPSLVTQLMVLENTNDPKVAGEVDKMLKTLKIAD